MPDLRFAIPGDPETRTGGYIYDRRLAGELVRLGWSVRPLSLGASFPRPTPLDLATAAGDFAALPDGCLVLVDGLAFGAMPELAEKQGPRLRLVGLVHHPLAYEAGLAPAARAVFLHSERRALHAACAVICTSETTAQALIADYGVVAGRIIVARPGTDPAKSAKSLPRRDNDVPHLLSVGTVTRRKGHDLLIEALARVSDLPWRCTIAGSQEREREFAASLREKIARLGLGKRIELAGDVADLSDLYRQADVFVLPSLYEGYGMAFAEALQQGLPVIGTTAGAIPEVVPPSAGILVAPSDVAALAAAVRRLIFDPSARRAFAAGANEAAATLPRWDETARIVATALQAVVR